MKNGFVKIPRSVLESGAASEDELLGLYVRMFAAANWKAGWFKRHKIEAGQFAFSWRNVQTRLYPTATELHPAPAVNTIRRRMEALRQMGMIDFQTIARQFSVCTVLGVSEFDTGTGTRTGTRTGTDRRRVKKEKKVTPAITDVEEYAASLDPKKYADARSHVDAFHNYYTANGWTQGRGKPIKDWKAAFLGWIIRQKEFSGSRNGQAAEQPPTQFDYAKDSI